MSEPPKDSWAELAESWAELKKAVWEARWPLGISFGLLWLLAVCNLAWWTWLIR